MTPRGSLLGISAQTTYSYFNAPPAPPYADYATVSATASAADTTRARMTYTYDDRNRLTRVNPDGSGLNDPADAKYSYNSVGSQAEMKYRNGVTTAYTYNTRNQLTLVDTTGGASASFRYDDTATAWETAGRRLANSGLRRGMLENIQGAIRWVGYSYDNLGRLTKESLHSANWAAATGSVQYDSTPGYDANGFDPVGNRQQRIVSSFPGLANGTTTYATYDENDRLGSTLATGTAAATFDGNGNTLMFDLDGNATWDQGNDVPENRDQYDVENHLTRAKRGTSTIAILYDGDGNRVEKTVTPTGGGADIPPQGPRRETPEPGVGTG